MNQKISLYLFKQSSQRQEGVYSHYYHSFFDGYGLKRELNTSQFLEVLVPLYVCASCHSQHSIHHVCRVRIDKMTQEVWIRSLQEERQAPPVEGELFQFYLQNIVIDLHFRG